MVDTSCSYVFPSCKYSFILSTNGVFDNRVSSVIRPENNDKPSEKVTEQTAQPPKA
jgi:hypothetical protein